MFSNMRAKLLFRRRVVLSKESFAELVVWRLPEPALGSSHYYKYRLAFIHKGNCVIRYDNEAGKGDHRHINTSEYPYPFKNIDQLLNDFLRDIRRWQNENSNS